MSLRTRIALVVATVALVFSLAGYAFQRVFLYEQFLRIERQEAINDLRRCEDAVEGEMRHVAVWCGDWAAWDDPYKYLTDGNPEFITTNVTNDAMANTRIDAMWLVAADGTVRHARAWDHQKREDLLLPELPGDRFPLDHPLLRPRPLDEPVCGILRTSCGPLLIASRQVIKSDFTGPSTGWFICGRLLSPALVTKLSLQAHVKFDAWDIGDARCDSAAAGAFAQSKAADRVQVVEESDDTLAVLSRLDDIHRKPALVLRAEVARDISRQGADSMRAATVSGIAAGAAMIAVLVALLGITVVAPLRRLRDHALRIGRSDDLAARSGIVRTDEIGSLAGSFDDMVGRLRDSRDRLAETARRAGVADMARGVIHNVGNLLTGVNVTASAIAATHRTSRTEGLLRGADLVAEHRQDLARFLTQDERGRLLPEYMAQAAAACRQERAELLLEIQCMQAALEQAAQIVARQVEFATSPSLAERTDLETAVAGAMALAEPALRRHGVTLERSIESGCEICVDRMKLAQILLNLLTNAKEAMSATDPALRRLVVSASARGDRVRIAVKDTGCGVAPEDLAHLFTSGFSTKGGGRGLGLHYCSVTAAEMGGSVEAASDGPGRGATFTVDLPQAVAAPSPAAARELAPATASHV